MSLTNICCERYADNMACDCKKKRLSYKIINVEPHCSYDLEMCFCSCSTQIDKHYPGCPNFGKQYFVDNREWWIDLTVQLEDNSIKKFRYHISKVEEL